MARGYERGEGKTARLIRMRLSREWWAEARRDDIKLENWNPAWSCSVSPRPVSRERCSSQEAQARCSRR